METAMTIHFSEMLSGWAIRRLIASIAIPRSLRRIFAEQLRARDDSSTTRASRSREVAHDR